MSRTSVVAVHDELIIDRVRELGTASPADVSKILLGAGATTYQSASDAGTVACRRLVRAGKLARVGRGAYAARSANDDVLVCIPGRGGLKVGELRELRAAAGVYAAVLARAHGRASAGLDERLQGEFASASAFAVLLDMIIERGTRK
ncbi:MAG TPA: type IV toxin-antitoxin system AbiEi family antitoxin domain-containing protein [Candidatus Krumholzibacteria bacterium]|nr:type IV toxin-antitoxin system AbiEi family antitoxin domain-containing protein [Candidatus Krumholzibacteria bacterium]HPD73506.1 type IV toxin-antitoxin system AbiEi family antitoxin domain-containing protein [Candidatus Krumholzibacteria bacterium]HRY42292.1 type IV toxin-antitoxin system AbiEi family antitoxin domain-containing protein [Candidatus Krumholzibacteria bacterium]